MAYLPGDDLKSPRSDQGPALEALVREGTPVLKVVHDTESANENTTGGESLLDAIARDDAQQMLAVALQAEIDAYIDAHRGEVDELGHRPSTGFISERQIPSNQPSPPSGCASASPRAPAHELPGSRWRSS